jgi:hypothetical protein
MTTSRRTCRQGRPCEPRNLAEAIYCCAHHSGLDIATVAERIGVSRSYLYDATNPDRQDTQFQARLLVPLMVVTGNLTPLRFLSREFHVALIELPAVPVSDGDIQRAFLRAVKEIGEAAEAIERVLGGGLVAADEFNRARREVSETIEALALVQQKFAFRAEGRVA